MTYASLSKSTIQSLITDGEKTALLEQPTIHTKTTHQTYIVLQDLSNAHPITLIGARICVRVQHLTNATFSANTSTLQHLSLIHSKFANVFHTRPTHKS